MAEALTFASGLSATYGELRSRKPWKRKAKVIERDHRLALRLKRERAIAGCEACGWLLGPDAWEALHAHHVVPLSCGGADDQGNLAVLCPNHHAQAHRTGKRDYWRWTGARTRTELLASLGAAQ